MLRVLEKDFHFECNRTTKTADLRNAKNPDIPVIQSDANINAPPYFSSHIFNICIEK